MKYKTEIAKEIFRLYEGCELSDVIMDEEGSLMLVFKNNRCIRGLTLEYSGYQSRILNISNN